MAAKDRGGARGSSGGCVTEWRTSSGCSWRSLAVVLGEDVGDERIE